MKAFEFVLNHPIIVIVGLFALMIAVDAGAQNSRKAHLQENISRVPMGDGTTCFVLEHSVSCVR